MPAKKHLTRETLIWARLTGTVKYGGYVMACVREYKAYMVPTVRKQRGLAHFLIYLVQNPRP